MKLTKKIYDEILAHMRAGYPNEACGLLAGEGPSSVFYPMKNEDASPISYFMDPKEQLTAFKKMRERGVELSGIVHSHVASEAYPSQKDMRLAFYPDASYLIVSLADRERPVLRSFKIREERITEEEVVLV